MSSALVPLAFSPRLLARDRRAVYLSLSRDSYVSAAWLKLAILCKSRTANSCSSCHFPVERVASGLCPGGSTKSEPDTVI